MKTIKNKMPADSCMLFVADLRSCYQKNNLLNHSSKLRGFILVIMMTLCTGVFAQKNEGIINALKERYPGCIAYYNDNGWYGVILGDKKGACDLTGKEIIAPNKYTYVLLSNGCYYVKIGDKEGACDLNGKEVVPCKYNSVLYSGGEFMARNSENESYFTLNDIEIPTQESNSNRTTLTTSSSTPASANPQESQQDRANRLLALGRKYAGQEDKVNAAKYYKEAADLNNAEAQFLLSLSYHLGTGVEKNEAQGEIWMKRSALNGYLIAQLMLGVLQESNGAYGDALVWYQMAALQGDEDARQKMVALQIKIGANQGQPIQNNQGNYNNQPYNNQKVKVVCPSCNGTGKTCQLKSVPTYGITSNVRHRCHNCQQLISSGYGDVHVQVRCSHCQGTGYK
jgi:hypothetical protein